MDTNKNIINLNMSKEELERLFERYNFFTLDSLGVLLDFSKNYDLENTNIALNNIQKEKYDSIREEFEGINEYDYILRINNFDISEIIESIDSLNYKELNYLKSIFEEALNNIINKGGLEIKIIPMLKDCIYIINNQSTKLSNKHIIDNLTVTEMEVFLNKYSITELESLSIVFDNVRSYNIECIREVFQKVYEEKCKTSMINDEVEVHTSNFSILNLTAKNDSLSDEELNYLYKLVEDASLYLDSIQEYEDEYKEIIEDFDSGEYPITEMCKLEESLCDEMNKRKQSQKNSVKIYKKNN